MSLASITGYQLTRANLVSLSNFERAVGQTFKLRPVEYTILQMLAEDLCSTPSQLAKELQMTPPSVSVWLDKLAARDLLRRSRSDTDGRTQQLQLTAAGQQLTKQAHQALLRSEERMLACLSPGERVMLLEILHKLSEKSASSPDKT